MIKLNTRGIYLIQEKGCLNPNTGAFQHISMGLRQLSNNFEIELFLNSKQIDLTDYTKQENVKQQDKTTKPKKIKGLIYGTIKDLQIFFTNLSKTRSLIKSFKAKNPKFIYERVSYLDFSGLIACKYLKIPHFYEANGFQYKGRRRYYKSLFVGIAKILEKMVYRMSNHVFFVGSYGDFWKIDKNNWTNVENGIEKDFIIDFKEKEISEKDFIDICFVGRLMDHQKINVFVEALSIFNSKSQIRINLVGSGLACVESEIKNLDIQVVNHGFVSRSNIVTLLSNFDIAIISGSNPFQSCMKLFDYGAAGCAVIAPDIHNLKLWFREELFFFNGSSEDLSKKLDILVKNKNNLIQFYGKNLNVKVRNSFTWETIFNQKSNIIKKYL
ncbi:glycosyltransferase [Winogradskyella endarachnes]|uniref:Glycosyltransferase n=1 Tax=Winogradskyella endarachnes TaxID=2681965 RepID=A0A6L6U6M0_9FLAO|nr:glycosyltransferase [Winogradskyella endarachnes]MUU77871.1 glycosyltransferase [Winogradskyella endarachnes]